MTLSADEAAKLSQSPKLDYQAIGFLCGLEIHQQLDTRKLFSLVPSDVVEPDEVARRTVATIERRLQLTGSELGELDAAAVAESRKGLRFRYLAIDGLTSLVETDEEPPHPMSEDALDVALTLAGLAGSRPMDEIHVMRKTVIDGSNTSGFQRSALVATGGRIEVEGGGVPLWTVALEEDSARKLDEPARDGVVSYTLDRLGIPLIEIATGPDCKDPQHAQRVAARIGALLRSIVGPDGKGRVKRGLGTIRQDLNVSVAVGSRVEIKGAQDLRALPRVIEAEARRQLWMHHVAESLRSRGFQPSEPGSAADVSALFAKSEAKMVRDALGKGGAVFGLRIPKAAGLLKGATKDGPRLGRELADHAKVQAGVKGIFHSDELPAYGITDVEVGAVRTALHCGATDAFVLCAEREAVARRALDAVAERMRAALTPAKEVRGVQPDDSTRFLRPMPGAARMYPETDVPPIRVTRERWAATLAHLPPKPEDKVQAFVQAHGLSPELAKQLVAEGFDADFQALVQAGADAALAARILLQFLPELQHPARALAALPAVVGKLRAGGFAKEALPKILQAIDAGATPEEAVPKSGGGAADAAAVDAVVRKVVAERLEFVKSRGLAAQGPLMGPVMAELRGKVDGAVIAARLKAAIEAAVGDA
ncbi:MAG: Glu-tRNA(Gln) amidotransferase subunit GatE [Thermoplasmatota archaeon]|nr:Glu-tRNA(Gln) amidotransferase subunit GatE [Halobacteriales archaeon]